MHIFVFVRIIDYALSYQKDMCVTAYGDTHTHIYLSIASDVYIYMYMYICIHI